MTHAYVQSAYLAAPYSFEAVKNTETEQIRPLAGLKSYYQFNAGVMNANEVMSWKMVASVVIESFWVGFAGSPAGTMTISLLDLQGDLQQNIILNTNNNGEKFDNAWAYLFSAPFPIPKGWTATFKPSVAIAGMTAYAEPCLFFDAIGGIRV